MLQISHRANSPHAASISFAFQNSWKPEKRQTVVLDIVARKTVKRMPWLGSLAASIRRRGPQQASEQWPFLESDDKVNGFVETTKYEA
jgi:hypothetical protein